MKRELVGEVSGVLESAGYQVLDCSGLRSSFDLIAKGDRLVLVKVLSNIEGLTRKSATELLHAASTLSAVPLVVGDHMKSEALQPGVIYSRYDVQVISPSTLCDIASGSMPRVFSVRGNYCVRIDSSLLTRLRRSLDLTQDELASRLGVSKQTVHRYEFSGRVSLDVAERLLDLLEDDLRLPSEVFVSAQSSPDVPSPPNLTGLKRFVLECFRGLGFSTSVTNAPFDIVAVESSECRVFTSVSDDSRRLRLKAEVIRDVSELLGGFGVCVSNRSEDSEVVFLKPRVLSGVRDQEELFSLIRG